MLVSTSIKPRNELLVALVRVNVESVKRRHSPIGDERLHPGIINA